MPLKNGRWTEREKKFADAYVETRSRAVSERAAGLKPGCGYAVLARPEVIERIRVVEMDRLAAEGLPLAVSTLIEGMKDTKQPLSARRMCANDVIERFGVAAVRTGKELSDMTSDDIQVQIEALELLQASLSDNVLQLSAEHVDDDLFS